MRWGKVQAMSSISEKVSSEEDSYKKRRHDAKFDSKKMIKDLSINYDSYQKLKELESGRQKLPLIEASAQEKTPTSPNQFIQEEVNV